MQKNRRSLWVNEEKQDRKSIVVEWILGSRDLRDEPQKKVVLLTREHAPAALSHWKLLGGPQIPRQ
jgi:hypothetical protein